MIHTPKNQTTNKTYHWKNERQRLTDFYNGTPFYGNELAEKLYTVVKKQIPSLIQAAVCGVSVSLVVYKQDVDMARHLLSGSFKKPIKEMTCPYTEFVTLHLMNK